MGVNAVSEGSRSKGCCRSDQKSEYCENRLHFQGMVCVVMDAAPAKNNLELRGWGGE